MSFLTLPSASAVDTRKALLHRWLPEWVHERDRIEAWLTEQLRCWMPPIYASVDIRHSSSKIAVVDTNLFSAGFNNLNAEAIEKAIIAFQNAWKRRGLSAERLLLIPERHTRNHFYQDHLKALVSILKSAGSEVKVGYWQDAATPPELVSALEVLGWERIERTENSLHIGNWIPDGIVLNNDFSSGIPEIFKGISTPVYPSAELGWHRRLKSTHFAFYQKTVESFSSSLNIDAWPLECAFGVVDGVDFHTGEGIEALQDKVAGLLQSLREKYVQRGYEEAPYVVIKPDSGTYGMGVMIVHDASELTHLNRKQRNKMSVIKDGVNVHRVIIQEGIRSEERWAEYSAESVLYMVDDSVVGRFYRVHPERDAQASLNAPGMVCEPVPFDETSPEVYLHTVVARIALIAAARELDAVTLSAENPFLKD